MKRFKKLYLEITNVCNLKCDFCPETKRRPEYMTIERFVNFLDQIKPFTDYLYFHVKGEPLLHPNIDKFLDISQEKGFYVNITTNGTLLKANKDKLINKTSLRQINISLHSMYGNDFSNNKEYIKDVLSVVKEFRDNTDIIISLRLWNLEEDNNTATERNKELLEIIEDEFRLEYKIKDIINPRRGVKLADKLYLNQDIRFTWPALDEEEDDGEGFCYGLRDQVAILVDGTVVPCCLDGEGAINLGSIGKTGFKDIIQSERAIKIFEGFSNRIAVEELCRKCGYRRKF